MFFTIPAHTTTSDSDVANAAPLCARENRLIVRSRTRSALRLEPWSETGRLVILQPFHLTKIHWPRSDTCVSVLGHPFHSCASEESCYVWTSCLFGRPICTHTPCSSRRLFLSPSLPSNAVTGGLLWASPMLHVSTGRRLSRPGERGNVADTATR